MVRSSIHNDRIIPLSTEMNSQNKVDVSRSYRLESVEMSVLETFERATVRQVSVEPVFYNMLRGKKIIHIDDSAVFDYLPGSTMVVPSLRETVVEFPDSSLKNPTQCISMTIDPAKISQTVHFLNERYPRQDGQEWVFDQSDYRFFRNEEISTLIFKLFQLATQNDFEAQVIADLTLSQLLVMLMQLQNLKKLQSGIMRSDMQSGRFQQLIQFIQNNLSENLDINVLTGIASMSKSRFFRKFREEFGMPPLDFIIGERIAYAKNLLHDSNMNISDVCYATGFNNPNYFSRMFKQREGLTPKDYRMTINESRVKI